MPQKNRLSIPEAGNNANITLRKESNEGRAPNETHPIRSKQRLTLCREKITTDPKSVDEEEWPRQTGTEGWGRDLGEGARVTNLRTVRGELVDPRGAP